MVALNGFTFCLKSKSNAKVRWCCSTHNHKNCPANLWTVGTDIIRIRNHHNHPPVATKWHKDSFKHYSFINIIFRTLSYYIKRCGHWVKYTREVVSNEICARVPLLTMVRTYLIFEISKQIILIIYLYIEIINNQTVLGSRSWCENKNTQNYNYVDNQPHFITK